MLQGISIIWHWKRHLNQMYSALELIGTRQRVLYFLLWLYLYNHVFIFGKFCVLRYLDDCNSILKSIWNLHNWYKRTYWKVWLTLKWFARGRCWRASIFYNFRPNERHYSSLQRFSLSCLMVWLRFLIFFRKKTCIDVGIIFYKNKMYGRLQSHHLSTFY